MALTEDDKELIKRGICPRCRNNLIHEEGCVECPYCGWAACEEA